MAADIPVKCEPENPCCTGWKVKYTKLEEKRNALRQAVKLYEQEINKIQAENLNLKKAYEEERARANNENDEKVKESAIRVSLENDISELKSEISSLQKKGRPDAKDGNEEVKLLQARISEGEKEIKRLNELVKKERMRADSEKKNAEAEKKKIAEAGNAPISEGEKEIKMLNELVKKERTRADSEKKNAGAEKKRTAEAWKFVKAEKSKADEERRLANTERKKAEEYRLELEALKKEAEGARSKLVSQTFQFEEVNKKLKAEKKKVIKERKRADSEKAKAEEQRKLAEANSKKALEEKHHADNLSRQLEVDRCKIEKLQKEIRELVSHRNSDEAFAGQPDNDMWLHSEILKRNADASKLALEYLKSEEANKRFDAEKQKVITEKQCADSEMVKAEEQRKLTEMNRKKAIEEKYRADQLSQQVEEDRQKIEKLLKEIHELVSCRKPVKASFVSPDKHMNAEIAKLKLLKKQLKFEKMKVKHAIQVANLEKNRNGILREELGRLKLEFVQFSHRLDVLDSYFSPSTKGIDDLEETGKLANMQRLNLKRKLCGVEPYQMCSQPKNYLVKHSCSAMDTSDPFLSTLEQTTPLLPLSGGSCTESISGIDSKLESLLGGSYRNILQSSAINSTTASFSDGQFVGSQENGAFSVTASAKLVEENLNPQPTISRMSGEVTKKRCNENLAVAGENSIKSPLSIEVDGRVSLYSRKRKKIVDAESKYLYSVGKMIHLQIEDKLSVLHGMLNKQIDKPFEEGRCLIPNLQGDSYAKHDRVHKKRKASLKEKVATEHLGDGDEQKETKILETTRHNDANAYREASQPASNLVGTTQACRERVSDSVTSDEETMVSFKEVADGDYMKLLELQNAVDEECYRIAMERPVSPTLPEIELQGTKTANIDIDKPLVEESFYQGLPNGKETVRSCSFDVINMEIDSNRLKFNVSGTIDNTLLHQDEGTVDCFNNPGNNESGVCNTIQVEKAGVSQIWDSSVDVEMSNMPIFKDDRVKFPCEGVRGLAHDYIPKHYVVFSDIKDKSSISRIFCATRTCIARCSLVSQSDWVVQKILLALAMEEDLSSKEKVCVFLSLLLLNFSAAASGRFRNFLDRDSFFCLDSFAGHIRAVMSNMETRSMFTESCCFDELLNLIEDFLIGGTVMVYNDATFKTLVECDSRVSILLDGVNIVLSYEAASTDLLVSGSIILASICAAVNHVSFICEASYNIFRMRQCDSSLMLTILHVFAYVCGEKYFTLSNYTLIVMVLKSIVTFLESKSISVAAASRLPFVGEFGTQFPQCAKCPFSEDAVSVDIVIMLLLEKLQNYGVPETMHQNLMESVNPSNSRVLSDKDDAERSSGHVGCVLDMNCDASCCLNKSRMPATQPNSVVNGALCDLIDVLSLVELVACNMSWDWTCVKVVPQLLKMLDACVLANFSAAIVILLGQLGRFGVDAGGYEDNGVENLRCKLSALLCETKLKLGLPFQIATVTALVGLISLDFAKLIQNNVKHPASASQSVSADCIKKWYSSLSKEQQDLSFSLLQAAGVNKN